MAAPVRGARRHGRGARSAGALCGGAMLRGARRSAGPGLGSRPLLAPGAGQRPLAEDVRISLKPDPRGLGQALSRGGERGTLGCAQHVLISLFKTLFWNIFRQLRASSGWRALHAGVHNPDVVIRPVLQYRRYREFVEHNSTCIECQYRHSQIVRV